MSKKTDFVVGKQQLFSTSPCLRVIQREKKLKYFNNPWRRNKFPCTLVL